MSTQRERQADNKNAFDEIIGDPFSKYDLAGQYETMRCKHSVHAVDNSKEANAGTINQARPNAIDFVTDVENAIRDGLLKYATSHNVQSRRVLMDDFLKTYIVMAGEYLNQRQRSDIEQLIGQILIARKISPVVRYFTALRQKRGRNYVRQQRQETKPKYKNERSGY